MAKNIPPSGRSKVRMLFLEADVAAGDIKELTAALANAVRPTHTIQRIESVSPTSPTNHANGVIEEPVDAPPLGEESQSPEEQDEVDTGPAKPRKYRSPKPVADLDMNAGGKSFTEFANEKGPTSDAKRYLVAAAWLAEYARLATITVDHVYTCYKSAGWTYNVIDPGLPLRHLKKDGLGETKWGKFTINHIGLARVEKMKPSQP